ncbi:hypothetical protein NDU88_004265 [Pleurodeles waltl]|uniref:Uncharacterized protein n=1 Tax=Pleurodeles waltl TaxID=8319 RepID=A0AAV7LQF3_PLEWA|nr:hypothetical protein NDU88_004265 [Pleurodeles waltl]
MSSREPCRCWRFRDSPEGESLPILCAPGGAPVRHVSSAGVSRRVPRPDNNASGSPKEALTPNTFGRSSSHGATPPQVRQTSRLASCSRDGPNAARHVLPKTFFVQVKDHFNTSKITV